MLTFLVVHTMPANEDQLKDLAKTPRPEGISWKITYCNFEENKFFCEWTANDAKELEALFKQYSVPFDVIYPVRKFDPDTLVFD